MTTDPKMITSQIPAAIPASVDQNGAANDYYGDLPPVTLIADESGTFGLMEETSSYVPEPFRLIVGVTYVTACKQRMRVITEEAGLFLGLVESQNGLRAMPEWYRSDGTVDRDFDKFPDQDAYDVIRIYREPDRIFLIKKDGYYTSNNCIMSRDNAVKIALERGGEIIEFLEVTAED